jgi:Undecaprenyl-phosphate glucose phosphotransferase
MAGRKHLSVSAIATLLRAADALALVVAGFAAYFVRFGFIVPDHTSVLVIVCVTVVGAIVFQSMRLYEYERIAREPMQLQRLGTGLLIIAFLTLAAGYFTQTSDVFSRVWASIWGLFAIALLVAIRAILLLKVRRWRAKGLLTRRIAVVGAGPQGQRVVRHFSESDDPGVVLAGVFDDRRSRVPNQIGDNPVRGTVDDLLQVVKSEPVDEVIIALPWSAESRLLELMQKLRTAPVHVRLSPDAIAFRFPHRSSSALSGVNMLNVFDRPVSEWSRATKRLEDLVLSILCLVFVAPLAGAVALAVKLESRGPVLIRQPLHGFDNKVFGAITFRTLRGGSRDDERGRPVAPDDPRLTRVGRFLWRTGIDVLPRFLNVLGGTMSIVGPRARRAEAASSAPPYEEIVNEYFARHGIRPGITGWAQVNGWWDDALSQEQTERRIEWDLEYVESWSLWLDVRIIVTTPLAVLQARRDH